MTKNRKRDLLFLIENEVQFESLRPLLVCIKKNKLASFDILVPSGGSSETVNLKDIYEGGAKIAKDNNFEIIRCTDGIIAPELVKNTKYQVLLAAYMYDWYYQNLDIKYRIMFPYASYYFNKPNWTIKQFIGQDYLADALLSHAVGTKPVTDIFTRTYIVPSLKLMDYKPKKKVSKKPVLFFAPSYNEIDFAKKFLSEIANIRKKYTVIMRGHHRVVHSDNGHISAQLYDQADEVYDMSKFSITDALGAADVVLSDNSAVIFDAIYCGVPVALFCEDPDSLSYRDIHTAQAKLVSSGDILWTNTPDKIIETIDATLDKSMLARQEVMRQKFFPIERQEPVQQWLDVLNIYIHDKLPEEYYFAKKYWIERFGKQAVELHMARHKLGEVNNLINQLNTNIELEKNPGVKIATKRLYEAWLRKFRKAKDDARQ